MIVSSSPAPRRILYVITKANWGGAQRYVFDLVVEARERGHVPALAYGEPGLLSERAAALGVSAYQIPGLVRDPSPADDLRALFSLRALFKEQHPDVVHLNSSKAGLLGALAGRLAGVKRIVFTAHGWAFTEPRGAVARSLFILFHYLTVLLSTNTIAVSDAVARPAKKWPLVGGTIRTIRLGMPPTEFLTKDAARAALVERDPSLDAEGLWVGTIAELHKNKGLDVGIEAWKEAAPAAHWLILGGGEEETALKEQSAGLASLHLLGFVPEAAKCLKAFDLFLLPSRTEALGYVLLEAGFAGVPALASDVGGIPEIVTDASLRVPSGDAHALARRLGDILAEPASLPSKGAALHARVTEAFSFARMAEATFALY